MGGGGRAAKAAFSLLSCVVNSATLQCISIKFSHNSAVHDPTVSFGNRRTLDNIAPLLSFEVLCARPVHSYRYWMPTMLFARPCARLWCPGIRSLRN